MTQNMADTGARTPTQVSVDVAPTEAGTAEAALLEKHAEDIERVAIVLQEGFEGAAWKSLAEDLASYAWPRLHAKLTDGTIGHVETGSGHPALRPDVADLLRVSVSLRDELIVGTLHRATEKFKEHLEEGRWEPGRGKSLMSYFFGTAAGAFWDEYKTWLRHYDNHRDVIDFAALEGFEHLLRNHPYARTTDTALVLDQRRALSRILAGASSEQRMIAGSLYEGQTQAVIASELGMTQGAVTHRMRKLRGRANALVRAGLIDPLVLPGRQGRSRSSRTVTE